MKRIRFKRATRGFFAAVIVGLLVWGFIWSRTQWIPAGYVGLIYNANAGLQKKVFKPQAVFVGWREQLYTYPTKLQAAIYTQDPSDGEVKSADGILVTTNDNANTVFDMAVIYRVRPEDVFTAFSEFGPISIDDIQSLHIRRAVKEAINVVGTRYDLFELMGPKREQASREITDELRNRLAKKGITVEQAMLGGCYPSADIQSKITTRVNSFVELEISKLKQQIAEIQRQIAVVQGEADSQARTISASQTQDRSLDMLRLDAEKEALQKWDGNLPQISSRPGQTVVLGGDVSKLLSGGQGR